LDIQYCPNPEGTTLSLQDALHPLFSLASLEDVHISAACVCDLDDSWVAQAAMAWPLLDHFSLFNRPKPIQPRLTLTGLVPLIKYCPNLRYINMQIDAKPVPFALLEDARNTSIQTINLQGSAIDKHLGVLRSLLRLFPNLTSAHGRLVRPQGPMSSIQVNYNNCWKEVNDVLGAG
jgi:hypothetical protein